METDVEAGTKGKKHRGIFHTLKVNSMEFCRSTSLHGLQYVGEAHRPVVERLFWLISFIISTAVVSYFIMKIYRYNKWDTSPVFVSFAETTTPVWDIPFPAITICPEIKVRQTLLNFTKLLTIKNKTDEEIENYKKAQLVCRNFLDLGMNVNQEINPGYEPSNTTSVEGMSEFLEEFSPDLSDVIFMCQWRGEKAMSCRDFFTTTITDDGLCHTFNILNAKNMFNEGTVQRNEDHLSLPETSHWSFDSGYNDSEHKDTYPWRAMRSGSRGGLSLMISLELKDVDPLCTLTTHGVKAVLHNPTDCPSINDQYFRIPADRDVVVGIKPRVMTTSPGLRSYSPKRRQCFFSRERHLRYFTIYTQQNCHLECFTNYTYKHCDCVTYYMPRAEDIPVCNIRKQKCTEFTSDLFASDDAGLAACNCMPACTEIKYDVETSQAQFKINDSLIAYDLITREENDTDQGSGLVQERMSKVAFYYKDGQFVTSHRSELFGPADFLASCGGLLGLYLGFSFLSLVEIVYFFTMRLFSNFLTHNKHKK